MRLQITSHVDYTVYFKNIKNFEKKRIFSDFVRKERNSFFKRKSGISVHVLAMSFVVNMAVLKIDMSIGPSMFRQSTITTIDNSPSEYWPSIKVIE